MQYLDQGTKKAEKTFEYRRDIPNNISKNIINS